MNKCCVCGVTILDDTHICPLCSCITSRDSDEGLITTYPRPKKKGRRLILAMRIYAVSALAAEVILAVINAMTIGKVWWSALTAAIFVYGYLTFYVSIRSHRGYRFKMLFQTMLGVLVVILIDWIFGQKGWSINYVLPAAFILIEGAILILMITNRKNWQSYIPMQILMLILSAALFVFELSPLYTGSILCPLCFAVCAAALTGTLIAGGRRALDELYRRFRL